MGVSEDPSSYYNILTLPSYDWTGDRLPSTDSGPWTEPTEVRVNTGGQE